MNPEIITGNKYYIHSVKQTYTGIKREFTLGKLVDHRPDMKEIFYAFAKPRRNQIP